MAPPAAVAVPVVAPVETTGVEIGGWKISACTGSIASSVDADALTDGIGVKAPTMLFSSSHLTLAHGRSGVSLEFSAKKALESVGARDDTLQVRCASQWQARAKDADVQLCEGPVTSGRDWTYTTSYSGTLLPHNINTAEVKMEIDIDALKDQTIPIVYFASVNLFEDELDDNGSACYRVRIRTMPDFLFILARFYLRIDGVLVRVLDTRYFHRYSTDTLVMQKTRQESSFDSLHEHALRGSDTNDGDVVASKLPFVDRETINYTLASD